MAASPSPADTVTVWRWVGFRWRDDAPIQDVYAGPTEMDVLDVGPLDQVVVPRGSPGGP